jgi:hypothetical protein
MQLVFKQITQSGSTIEIVGKDMNNLVDNVLLYRRGKSVGSTEYNTVYNDVRRQVQKKDGPQKRTITEIRQDLEALKQRKSKRKIGFRDAYRASKAIVDIARGNIENQEEIQRRSDICFGCPLISDVSDCMACGAGSRITKEVLSIQKESNTAFQVPVGTREGRTGSESLSKMFCGHCGCACLTLCVSKMKHIRTEDPVKNQSRPDKCWMKRNGVNFKDDNQPT